MVVQKLLFTLAIVLVATTVFCQFELEIDGSVRLDRSVYSEDPNIGIRLVPREQCEGTILDLGLSLHRVANALPDRASDPCDPGVDDVTLFVVPQNYSNENGFTSYLGSPEDRWSRIYSNQLSSRNIVADYSVTTENLFVNRQATIHKTIISDDPNIGIQLIPEKMCDEGIDELGVSVMRTIVSLPDLREEAENNQSPCPANSSDNVITLFPENYSNNTFYQSFLGSPDNRWSVLFTQTINATNTISTSGLLRSTGGMNILNSSFQSILRTSSDGAVFAQNLKPRTSGQYPLAYDIGTGEIYYIEPGPDYRVQESKTNELKESVQQILRKLESQENEISQLKNENIQLRKLLEETN